MSSPRSPDTASGGPADPVADAVAGEDRDLRSARRALILFVIAVAAAVVGGIALFSGLIGEDSEDTTISSAGSDEVDEIGPAAGEDVAPYVDARRSRLRDVEGRHAAVVSFASYVDEGDVDEVLGDGLDLVALLVALPGDDPRVVGSVAEARAAAAAEADSQLGEISELVDTVEDPEFAEFYRAELIRYRKVLSEIDRDDVVFGAVVIGRGGDLRALGARAGVRLVDVGASADLADDARFSGLRPEESVTVGAPPFRP